MWILKSYFTEGVVCLLIASNWQISELAHKERERDCEFREKDRRVNAWENSERMHHMKRMSWAALLPKARVPPILAQLTLRNRLCVVQEVATPDPVSRKREIGHDQARVLWSSVLLLLLGGSSASSSSSSCICIMNVMKDISIKIIKSMWNNHEYTGHPTRFVFRSFTRLKLEYGFHGKAAQKPFATTTSCSQRGTAFVDVLCLDTSPTRQWWLSFRLHIVVHGKTLRNSPETGRPLPWTSDPGPRSRCQRSMKSFSQTSPKSTSALTGHSHNVRHRQSVHMNHMIGLYIVIYTVSQYIQIISRLYPAYIQNR